MRYPAAVPALVLFALLGASTLSAARKDAFELTVVVDAASLPFPDSFRPPPILAAAGGFA